MAKLIALTRISVPKKDQPRQVDWIDPGAEFEPVSAHSRERLLRIGAAEEPAAKKKTSKPAKK